MNFLRALRPVVLSFSLLALGCVAAHARPLSIGGEINAALIHYNTSHSSAPSTSSKRLDSYTSRLAIKGGEDLGQGWAVDFLMGTGFRVDEGRGGLCNRECWVKLRGPWGGVRVGRSLAIYDDISLAWYFIDSAGNHNPLAMWANCGNNAGPAAGCFDAFLSRIIRYDTPKFAGFSGSFSISDPSQELANKRRAKIVAVGAEYQKDAWYVGLAHQTNRDVRADGLVDKATTLAIAWEGPVYIALGLEQLDYMVDSQRHLTRNYIGTMVRYTEGRNTYWANWGKAPNAGGDAPPNVVINSIQNKADAGASMWTLGWQYKMSKKTMFYVFYNTLKNQKNGIYTMDPGTPAIAGQGSRISALAFGMQNRF